ncbi:MAG: T9SS type A sorting domain-containing protein [Bacteroidetes bacterium]|nr:T9SS type A sorting domain-containing protein [Bacteroidota bacterium]
MITNKVLLYADKFAFHTKNTSFFHLLLLTLLLGISLKTSAIVNSHEWINDYDGYSIEQIPGTGINGVPEEFIAVGTKRGVQTLSTYYPDVFALHIIKLNASGNILASRLIWAPIGTNIDPLVGYESVRITPEYNNLGSFTNNFWIIAQARQMRPVGTQKDFIYCHQIDVNLSDPTPTNRFYIKNATSQITYTNLYPTHALCYNDQLYICGFAANGNVAYNNYPLNTSTDKIGVVIKCDINTHAISNYAWDTYCDYADYDMPLKMRLSEGHPGEILVTGGINTGKGTPAGILAMRLNSSSLSVTASNCVIPVSYYVGWLTPLINGLYGIDIYENSKQDVYILSNYFDNNTGNSWGIAKLKGDLTTYPYGMPSYVGRSATHDGWAKQFFYQSYNETNGSAIFKVVGEQADVFCQSTLTDINTNHPGSLAPNYTNVNPFISQFTLSWNSSAGMSGSVPKHTIHLSANGTAAYYSGFPTYNPPPVGSTLQDFKRLCTPSLQVNNDPSKDIITISPISSPTTANIGTKYLRTDNNGDENSCQNQVNDCTNTFMSDMDHSLNFLPATYSVQVTSILEPQNDYPTAIEHNCALGYYKTTNINSLTTNRGIDIYPNPASDKLNIILPKVLSNSDAFTFNITDVTGKIVYKTGKAEAGSSVVNISLPALTPGVYIGNVDLNGSKYTKKIVIE